MSRSIASGLPGQGSRAGALRRSSFSEARVEIPINPTPCVRSAVFSRLQALAEPQFRWLVIGAQPTRNSPCHGCMNCFSCDMHAPLFSFACLFPWGIPPLQNDSSLSCYSCLVTTDLIMRVNARTAAASSAERVRSGDILFLESVEYRET